MATRTRKPTQIPRVLASPSLAVNALAQKAPMKNAAMLAILWSREATCLRNLNRRGSATSSIQTVVNGTGAREKNYVRFHHNISNSQNALVVPKYVFNRLPCTPCRPRLMLMKARPTNVQTFAQAKLFPGDTILNPPLFQMAMAATIVNNA